MMQSRLRFVKVQDKSLNSLLPDSGLGPRKYNYSVMKLSLGMRDFVNNIVLKGRDTLAIILESGTIVLYNITKNEPIAVLVTDQWVSSVFMQGQDIWSIGKNRKLICQNYRRPFIRFETQEIRDHDGYFENGSLLLPTCSKNHFIYNAGYFMMKILDARTKKLIRKIDLQNFCKDLKKPPAGAIKEWHGCKFQHQILFLAPSPDGSNFYFIVYDYQKMREAQRLQAFPRINTSVYQVNYHLMVSSDELVAICFFELIDFVKRKLTTNFTLLQRTDRASPFKIRVCKPFMQFTDQITCKKFIDEHVRCKKNKVFSLSTIRGLTYTFVFDFNKMEPLPLEVLRKSNETLTSSLIVKNLSFCSSISGDVVVFETSSLCQNLLGDEFIPWKEEEKLHLQASDY